MAAGQRMRELPQNKLVALLVVLKEHANGVPN